MQMTFICNQLLSSAHELYKIDAISFLVRSGCFASCQYVDGHFQCILYAVMKANDDFVLGLSRKNYEITTRINYVKLKKIDC